MKKRSVQLASLVAVVLVLLIAGRGLRGTGDKREALPLFLSADAGC